MLNFGSLVRGTTLGWAVPISLKKISSSSYYTRETLKRKEKRDQVVMMMNITDRLLIPCSSLKTDMMDFRSSKSSLLQVGNHGSLISSSSPTSSRFTIKVAKSSSSSSSNDFLGANKFGKKYLIDAKEQPVPVESVRGKILALYFAAGVPNAYIDFYNTLKPDAADAFEMIYVAPWDCDPYLFTAVISTLPCLAVPFDDLDWRSYLSNWYNWETGLSSSQRILLIDTKDNNRTRVIFRRYRDLHLSDYIYLYGPLFYPFTTATIRQLEAQCMQLGRETSLSAILGSDSRDYLLDPHYNKVPISSLQDKHVLIYGVQSLPSERKFEILLGEIHNRFRNQGLEIVSIFLCHNGGDGEYETLWEDHLAQIPWLHLPVGDEKIRLLRKMLTIKGSYNGPILFVKPKGESLLDPYGYQVLQKFGFEAFPFTRKAAGLSLLTKLKGSSFKSFVDKASQFGFDFKSLIRNKADGGTELVSLSNILEGRGILLLFASLKNCSRERLNSLINVYLSQDESSSFEVILVSTDDDTQSFYRHFSVMPWLALQIPLKVGEYNKLCEMTKDCDFRFYSHFLAFGADQLLVQVGLLTKSFENCVFPFVNDAESSDHLAYGTTHHFNWVREADGTRYDEVNGWGRGIKHDIYNREDWCYGDGHCNIYNREALFGSGVELD